MTGAALSGRGTHPQTASTWVAPAPDAASHHPVNRILVDQAPPGARVVDGVVGFLGSWRLIVIQTVLVMVWIVGNVHLWFHFDPYPSGNTAILARIEALENRILDLERSILDALADANRSPTNPSSLDGPEVAS